MLIYDPTAPRPYRMHEAQAILSRIAAVAPTLRAIRTDWLPPQRDGTRVRAVGRHQVIIDRHPSKALTLQLVNVDHPNGPLKRLATHLSISVEQAGQIYPDLLALARLNPYGAWFPEAHALDLPAPPLSQQDMEIIRPTTRPYIAECLRDLQDSLPGVAYIEIQCWTETSHQGVARRRTYFHMMRGPDLALASIEAATLSFQLRHETFHDPEHHYHQVNQVRREIWIEQMGVTPEDFPVVLHLLPLFALSLPTPRLALRTPEQAEAFWSGEPQRAAS